MIVAKCRVTHGRVMHTDSKPFMSGAADRSRHRDVVIAGGGPVGLALACELAVARVSVVVLERLLAIDPTIKAGAIGPLAGEALARRGLEPAMAAAEATMMQHMQAMTRAAGG